jgi:hypothetical protein
VALADTRRHCGAASVRSGSPPVSNTASSCASSSCFTALARPGQYRNLPVEIRFWQSRRTSIPEHEHCARKWICAERFAARADQAINAAAEVGRLNRDQQPHLRRDLDHRPRRQNASASAARSITAPAPISTSSRSPSRPGNRTTVRGDSPSRPASSSTNPLLASATSAPPIHRHPRFESCSIEAQHSRRGAEALDPSHLHYLRQQLLRHGNPPAAMLRSPLRQPGMSQGQSRSSTHGQPRRRGYALLIDPSRTVCRKDTIHKMIRRLGLDKTEARNGNGDDEGDEGSTDHNR